MKNNNTEKNLRQQIKDLEKSVEIKEAIINELRSIINKNYHSVSYISSGTKVISVRVLIQPKGLNES